MINAVSGLPAIVIDTFKELQAEFDNESSAEFIKQADDNIIRKKESSKRNSGALSNPESPNYEQLAIKLKDMLNTHDMTLEFRLDSETNEMILKIIDNKTQEVIRQLPPELTLKIAKFVASILGTGQVTNARV